MSAYLNLPDGQMVPVRDGLVLGRVAGCDVVVDDTKASRKHACLHVNSGIVEIEDLDSSNGTLLNGKPVHRRMLRDGDEVQIGATVIVFRGGQPGASSAPRAAAVDDDVDLFGGDAPAAPAPQVRATAEPPAMPSPPVTSAPRAALPPAAPAPPSPPSPHAAPAPRVLPQAAPTAGAGPRPQSSAPAARSAPPTPPPRSDVVEFADEVVEVRSAPANRAAPAGKPADVTATSIVQQTKRPLQFARQPERRGPLGDDLSQLSGGARLMVAIAVLAGATGLAWFVMTLVA